MRIWLIKAGEPFPLSSSARLFRTGMMANILIERGHHVVWWTTAYDHFEKKYIADKFTIHRLQNNYELAILYPTTPYRKNISLARIKNHQELAQTFVREINSFPLPDIIVCSYPIIELAEEAIRFGQRHNIPVVVDIRDLWPDVFLEVLPRYLNFLGRPFLYFLNQKAQYVFDNAETIIGLTDEFLQWAYKKSNRKQLKKHINDFVVPMGYSDVIPDAGDVINADQFWEKQGVVKTNFNICFFGALGKQFDMKTVIEAAKRMQNRNDRNDRIKFIICGDGESLALYKEQASDLSNVLFTGRVDKVKIYSLMRRSSIGLAPYKNSFDFRASIGNKPAEYFSAGLPIISAVDGVLGRHLRQYNCGLIYSSGDPSDLVDKIMELYNNRSKCEKMSSNAQALYAEKFIAKKVYTEFAKKLEAISNRY